MPTVLDHNGSKIVYHAILIRFPLSIFNRLKIISRQSGKPVNQIIRGMVERELKIVSMISEPSSVDA